MCIPPSGSVRWISRGLHVLMTLQCTIDLHADRIVHVIFVWLDNEISFRIEVYYSTLACLNASEVVYNVVVFYTF